MCHTSASNVEIEPHSGYTPGHTPDSGGQLGIQSRPTRAYPVITRLIEQATTDRVVYCTTAVK